MDYYEELGLGASATEEEIHRAHRRLTKLLHPDRQTDRAMKLLAETQMRRLNAIVEILSDPERRREYNELLNGNLAPAYPPVPKPRSAKASSRQRLTWHSLPWWVGSTIGAVVLSVGAVWFWADNLGSSFGDRAPVYIPSQAPDAGKNSKPGSSGSNTPLPQDRRGDLSRLRDALLPSRASSKTLRATGVSKYQVPRFAESGEVASEKPSEPIVVSVPSPPVANGSPNRQDSSPRADENQRGTNGNPTNAENSTSPVPSRPEISPPPKIPASTLARTDAPSIPLGALPMRAIPKPSETAPPPKANTPPLAPKPSGSVPSAKASYPVIPPKPVLQDPLEGEWVYAPKEPEKRKPGFYPPEFIDLKLFWDQGALHGQYRARYEVTDKPISPDVSFILSPADRYSRKFVWQSSNGSGGTLKISSIDSSSIRIEWRTTKFSRAPALTAGTATLVRHSP